MNFKSQMLVLGLGLWLMINFFLLKIKMMINF